MPGRHPHTRRITEYAGSRLYAGMTPMGERQSAGRTSPRGVVIARVLKSGEVAIAESHALHLAATKAVRVSERPGPARADRLIAQLAAQIDRADVSIRWWATALTQAQWDAQERRNGMPTQNPHQTARMGNLS